LNIYGEARGEDLEGQIAVAQVTMNRVAHPAYPDDICSVVFQRKQFSWTSHPVAIKEPIAMGTSFLVAAKVLLSPTADPTKGSTHFHSRNAAPDWASRLHRVGRIGNHIFFRMN
jgi:spore germination cell wall hydrolase CwlJ-like protein